VSDFWAEPLPTRFLDEIGLKLEEEMRKPKHMGKSISNLKYSLLAEMQV
jgi:hypothetical protein